MNTLDVINYKAQIVPLLQCWSQYKYGLIETLRNSNPNVYAVANFNLNNLTPNHCRTLFNKFDQKLSRKLNGKSYSQKCNERVTWIAVPECASFLHYNVLMRVPPEIYQRFFDQAPILWRQVVPNGDFYLQPLPESLPDQNAVAHYTTKAFNPGPTIDHIVTSLELRRK